MDASGNIVLFYGALDADNSTSTSVDIEIKVAVSSDGIAFEPNGTAYRSSENGGENLPYTVINAQGGLSTGETGNWHVWSGKVHPTSLLMGETFSSLAKVSSSIPPSEERWMRMAAVELGGGEIALFMDDPVTVWKSDLAALDQYDGPIAEYPIPNNRNTGRAIFLDRESSTWFFYFRTGDWCNHTCDGHQIRLWTAPARLSDTESIPPRPPENLRAD